MTTNFLKAKWTLKNTKVNKQRIILWLLPLLMDLDSL